MTERRQKDRRAGPRRRTDPPPAGSVQTASSESEFLRLIRESSSTSAYSVVKNTLALMAAGLPVLSPRERQRELLQLELLAVLKSIYQQRVERQAQMERLIASMMPATAVPLPAYVLQARRNAAARDALLREFGAMTSADIGELAGSKSPNRAALAHRWKSDGRIFAVPHQGANYFPGFQFTEEGQPIDAIEEVLHLLGGRLAPWELALWFTRNNGWLAGRRPVDLLRGEPDLVIAAAQLEAQERVF